MRYRFFCGITFAFLGSALIGASLFVGGCAGDKKDGAVLARFDGGVIRESDFAAKVKNLPRELRSVVNRRRKDFLADMIDERFLEEEAKKRAIQDLPDVKELIRQAIRKITIAKLVELEVDRKVSLEPGEAEKYYEAHKEQFMTPLFLRASHILTETKEEAEAVRSQLAAGADFAETARAKSVDSTAARGGDLGFFQKGQLIPEFEEVAFKMSPGETSGVFHTQFGYHVIQLTGRAEPKLREFKSVRNLVERQLTNEKRSKRYREFMDKLKAGAKIEIDEKNLEKIEAPFDDKKTS